jgi:hypothetical protein
MNLICFSMNNWTIILIPKGLTGLVSDMSWVVIAASINEWSYISLFLVGSKLNLSTLYVNFCKILGITLTFHFSKYRSLYL